MNSTTKKILASSLGMAGAMAMGTVTAKADTTVTVNAGDNLNAIAQKYNVSADDIATANHLQNKELIFVGQKLTIPTKSKDNSANNGQVAANQKQDQGAKNSQSLKDSVNKAMSYLGTPYVWGGNKPGGFDCSGLVQYCYGIPQRTTYEQQALGPHIHDNVLNAPYGALVFYGSDDAPYHVAISLGDGRIIQAPNENETVKITDQQYFPGNYYVVMH
ncbi:C40 family peptidase [Limosilactobacillus sp. STM2_1]|uniref:C40 family peptidase n=1 Tax=Limosilactobacillus rudii TaxID=2759755 RepID=A0A7W3YLT6_9LACO|nr:NlpC/P60 family protein [Limosilactobacillus rudii]MBB1080119.1 C40 family peptidase [Limosilactobacillus rudii]MBB1096393.1 C40 family peptidase [Limosilactobacillus rudii]MCD7133606.1 NlpC/P60 family protein [Limosilactobacillus rudii]